MTEAGYISSAIPDDIRAILRPIRKIPSQLLIQVSAPPGDTLRQKPDWVTPSFAGMTKGMLSATPSFPRLLSARLPFFYGWAIRGCLCCAVSRGRIRSRHEPQRRRITGKGNLNGLLSQRLGFARVTVVLRHCAVREVV